jgi:hypothetical protein
MRFKFRCLIGLLTIFAVPLSAGRIVINSDEWTLADGGFTTAGGSNAANFAVNLATFLAGPGGNILIYSGNFGLTQSSLSTTLTGAGFNLTTSTGAFDPTGFDAIFMAQSLHSANTSDLVDFVNGGGGVYLAAGTNSSNAGLAASLFNPFLNTFGLSYANFHDFSISTDLIDDPSNPLFAGVTQLYYAGVNPVSTTGSSADASVVESSNVSNPVGLIAVYDDTAITPQPVPEPGTLGLLGAALCALALAFRRRKA